MNRAVVSKVIMKYGRKLRYKREYKIISIALHCTLIFHCICYSLLENDILFELFLLYSCK